MKNRVFFWVIGVMGLGLLAGCGGGGGGSELLPPAFTRENRDMAGRALDMMDTTRYVGVYVIDPFVEYKYTFTSSSEVEIALDMYSEAPTTLADAYPVSAPAAGMTRAATQGTDQASVVNAIGAMLYGKAPTGSRAGTAINYTAANGTVWTGNYTRTQTVTSLTAHGVNAAKQVTSDVDVSMTLSGSTFEGSESFITTVILDGQTYKETNGTTFNGSTTDSRFSITMTRAHARTLADTIIGNGTSTVRLTANSDDEFNTYTATAKITGNQLLFASDGYWVKFSVRLDSDDEGWVSGSVDWRASDGYTAHSYGEDGWVKDENGVKIATLSYEARYLTIEYLDENIPDTDVYADWSAHLYLY